MRTDPIVILDGSPESELSVTQMIDELRLKVATLPDDSLEARSSQALLDIMPGFIETLDRERKTFSKHVKVEQAKRLKNGEALNRHLMVLTIPIVNMLGALLLTLVPCDHDKPCPHCEQIQGHLLNNLMTNIELGVRGYLAETDRPENNEPLHS
jgi:hypothetical protein